MHILYIYIFIDTYYNKKFFIIIIYKISYIILILYIFIYIYKYILFLNIYLLFNFKKNIFIKN